MSIEESLEMLRTERISNEKTKILTDGFGVLVEVPKALGASEKTHKSIVIATRPCKQCANRSRSKVDFRRKRSFKYSETCRYDRQQSANTGRHQGLPALHRTTI